MKKSRLWAQIKRKAGVFVTIAIFGLSAAMPAGAQETQLPTSMYPAIGVPWTNMRAGSFEHTPAAARQGTEFAVSQPGVDWLNAQHAIDMETMLENGECKTVNPDGVVHDLVVYKRLDGHVYAQSGVQVALGPDVTALQCDLGDGVYGYFYTGSDKHCNNVAFTHNPPPIPIVADKKSEPRQRCWFVQQEVTQTPGSFVSLPAFHYCGCYIPGYTGVVPGGVQTTSKLVCVETSQY